jgi:excisionase family DNA binding protein
MYMLVSANMIPIDVKYYRGLPMVTIKEWFTVEEAAEYLRVSKRTIYKLTEEGRLPALRIGRERHRRFRKGDLDNVPRIADEKLTSEALLKLSAKSDPVLAELWDNDRDAAYDRV